MIDPSTYDQQHMNDLKHFAYVWSGCVNNSIWVWSLNYCNMTAFLFQAWTGNLAQCVLWVWHDDGSQCLYSQHMIDLKQFEYVWGGCENPSQWFCSLNHCKMTTYHFQVWTRNLSEIQNLCQQGCDNGMMMDPSAHTPHMNDLKQFLYIECGGNHSQWFWSLHHCTMILYGFQVWTRNLAEIQYLCQWGLW